MQLSRSGQYICLQRYWPLLHGSFRAKYEMELPAKVTIGAGKPRTNH